MFLTKILKLLNNLSLLLVLTILVLTLSSTGRTSTRSRVALSARDLRAADIQNDVSYAPGSMEGRSFYDHSSETEVRRWLVKLNIKLAGGLCFESLVRRSSEGYAEDLSESYDDLIGEVQGQPSCLHDIFGLCYHIKLRVDYRSVPNANGCHDIFHLHRIFVSDFN